MMTETTSKFRSGLEKQVADLLSNLGIDYEYETTKISYQIQHIYTPDFILPNKHVVLECKGYWDAKDRRKIKTIKKVITKKLYNRITQML